MTNEEEDLPMACLVDAGEEEDVASSEEAQREGIGRFADRVGVEVLDWCIHEDGGARPALRSLLAAAASGRRPLDVALVWQLSVLGFSPVGYRRHILPGAWTGPEVVPISEVDVVGASPACWMQGLVRALDEFFRQEDREGSRRSVWVWRRRQDS